MLKANTEAPNFKTTDQNNNAVNLSDFIKKFNLKIDLLADTDGSLCDAYGVWQEKEKNGVKKMGIVRSTFIIDKSGILVDAEYAVTADGHAALVSAG